MPILSNNPVLEREIRGRLRFKRRGGPQMLWIARLLGIVVLYYYARGLLGIWGGTPQDARDFWPLLVYGALSLVVLLAPALAATAISSEREQQTWEILATTPLTGAEVVLGKWLGRQIVLWLLLVILLPFLAVCAAHAGFGWLMLPCVTAFLLVTIACYSALGLLCSFQAKRTMTATASALVTSAFLCLGTLIINQVFVLLLTPGQSGTNWPVLWANPFYALGALINSLAPEAFGGSQSYTDAGDAVTFYLVGTLAVTAAALLFMVRRYRRAVRERS